MKFSFFARTGAPPHRPLKWPPGACRHLTRPAGVLALGTLAAHVFAAYLAWWPRSAVKRHHPRLEAAPPSLPPQASPPRIRQTAQAACAAPQRL